MSEFTTVSIQVPSDLEPKLERQIREYNQMRELGQQISRAGMLDPTQLC